ncbi:hypothetical protein [Paenibacillus amylolyticus]|uniref:hypothetical protein n=1 Tax=Paenibacillus amylolyticus TaxID=1451 RepID=UPI000FDC1AD0|nr:hypothetical protein [Paenibacillus amylolyticus]
MYNKQEWKDEIPDLTKPIMDQSTGKQKTDPQTGRPLFDLVQEGTRITSSRLNTMEGGIEAAHTLVEKLAKETAGNFVAVINGVMGLSCGAQGLKVTWTAGVAYVGGRRYEVTSGEMTLNPTQGQYIYVDINGVVNKTTSQATAKAGLPIFYVSTDTSGVISSEDRRVNLNIEELRKRIEGVESDIITKTNSAERNAKNYTDERVGPLPDLKTNAKGNAVLAINELFTSVSNGKELLANAITDMGEPTLATDGFQLMADNIRALETTTFLTEFEKTTPIDVQTTLRHVIKAGDLYIGVQASVAPYMSYSTNGLVWLPCTLPLVVTTINQVVHSNGMFIARANGNNLLRSTNGITWEVIPADAAYSSIVWNGLAVSGSRFCVTDGKSVLISNDGVVWNFFPDVIANVAPNIISNITGSGEEYGAGFVMSYPDSANSTALFYSSNGIDWQWAFFPAGVSPGVLNTYGYGEHGWIALGVTSGAISEDGEVWETFFTPPNMASLLPNAVIMYAAGRYIVGGQARNASNLTRGAVFTSFDGREWERIHISDDVSPIVSSFTSYICTDEFAIFYASSNFIAVFTGDVGVKSVFDASRDKERQFRIDVGQAVVKQAVPTTTLVTPDIILNNIARIPRNRAAMDWVNRTSIFPAVAVMAGCMVKGAFVGVCQLSTTAANGTGIYSNNGGASISTVSTPKVDCTDIAHNNAGLIIAVGQINTNATASAMYSTNGGLSWTAVATSQLSLSQDFGVIQWTGTKFIAVSRSGMVWSTTNGSTWTLEPVAMASRTGMIIDSAIAPNGMYLMTPYNILFSSDYSTFNKVVTVENSCLQAMAYGVDVGVLTVVTSQPTVVRTPDGWADLSKRGEVLTTVDGLNWKYNMLGTNNAGFTSGTKNFTDIVYSRGLFVATLNTTGNNIAISHDGENWIGRNRASGSSTTNFGRILAGGGAFLAFPGGSPNNTWMASGGLDQELYNAMRGF